MAISDRDGLMEIAYSHSVDGGASLYSTGANKIKVRTITLKELVEELRGTGLDPGGFKVRVLKMDCKGCEWDVINNETETLKLFDVMKIEYSGYLRNFTYKDLMERIEPLGYKCKASAHNEFAIKIGLDKHGVLLCMRVRLLAP